jgi:hypothetical protein
MSPEESKVCSCTLRGETAQKQNVEEDILIRERLYNGDMARKLGAESNGQISENTPL